MLDSMIGADGTKRPTDRLHARSRAPTTSCRRRGLAARRAPLVEVVRSAAPGAGTSGLVRQLIFGSS
jgi:hypothetical protein